ncbi:MAG: LysM peptidoglycan-binding domain-containing protein [Syntrophobacterales bacterium]|nr:MAG: LysM peptidoglycan-binding domain-containing protein [Syntrophobacterales bacterium]
MYKKFVLLVSLLHLLGSVGWPMTYHALRPGETLADVANAYYGDRDKAILLLQYNRIPDPKKILPGTKIAVPEIIRYTVKKGDTLAKIAHRFLGDQRRSRVLVLINHLDSPQRLTIGRTIIIPFDIPYIVKRGESLSMIANRYYANPNRFDLIATYNFMTELRGIKPGTEILIPIVDLEIGAKSAPIGQFQKVLLLPEEQLGFPWLEKGIQLYFAGEYRGALQSLMDALKRGLKREDDLCKTYRFLAYCHIALGEMDLGKKAFEKALAIRPSLKLDPTYISPKIMGVFEEAQGGK